MNPKILSMCSTRNRPKECTRMLNSYFATRSPGSEIVVYVADNDPYLQEYIDAFHGKPWLYFIGPHRYMAEVLNYFSCEIFPNCEFYQEVNDDHIYHTMGWDKELAEAIKKIGGWGMSWADNRSDHMNSAYMLSGNIVRTLGYFISPLLRHNYADCQIRDLLTATGKNLMCLVKSAHIEHRCWHDTTKGIGKMAPEDDNTRFVYSAEQHLYGCAAMKEWKKNYMPIEIRKIQQAMAAET